MNDLIGNTDATVWADAFIKLMEEKPELAKDKGTLIGWFANAIMAGYDEGRNAGENLQRNLEANDNKGYPGMDIQCKGE